MIDVKDCPRDQDVDTWFDEEFERQKTRGDKTAPVLKDITACAAALDAADVPQEDRLVKVFDTREELDAMMDDMMGDME